MDNRQRNIFQLTSPNVYKSLRLFFVVASASDYNPVLFSGLTIGVPALLEPARTRKSPVEHTSPIDAELLYGALLFVVRYLVILTKFKI